jgi:sugar O-acyltransferase (sialic acid O-acetyltransferase NeuD family)
MRSMIHGIYGAGGFGRQILPVAREQVAREGGDPASIHLVDDAVSSMGPASAPAVAFEEFLALPAAHRCIAIAVSDGRARERLSRRCVEAGVATWTVRAASSVVMEGTEIGEGAILGPFAMVTVGVRIGRHFHGNSYSYVSHDCRIGDFVTFGPAVKCNGNVEIADHAYLGAGAMIRQGRPGAPLVIGRGAVVGMGAVVLRDVPDGVTVVGNPARPL